MRHLGLALTVQLVAGLLLWQVAAWLPQWIEPPYPLWAWVVAQSVLAAGASALLRLPRWWLAIQALLPPLLALALWWRPPVWAVVLAGLGLWLVFRNALTEQVPLYLSNRVTRRALCEAAKTLPTPVRFVDLGCGLGGVVAGMARCPNVVQSVGVETAPLSLWVAKLRAGRGGAQVLGLDLWAVELGRFDLVYAFLSPAPMADLERKVLAEMAPGSLFISNSFPLPNVPATEIWQLDDWRTTHLYLYRFDEQGRLMAPEGQHDG